MGSEGIRETALDPLDPLEPFEPLESRREAALDPLEPLESRREGPLDRRYDLRATAAGGGGACIPNMGAAPSSSAIEVKILFIRAEQNLRVSSTSNIATIVQSRGC